MWCSIRFELFTFSEKDFKERRIAYLYSLKDHENLYATNQGIPGTYYALYVWIEMKKD